MKYVVGFSFDPSLEHVLLVLKNRPAWQAGKFNGIGGKIEINETPLQAMVREFYEETGLPTTEVDWKIVDIEGDDTYEMHIFTTRLDLDLMKLAEQHPTDEPIICFPVDPVQLEQRGVQGRRTLLENVIAAKATFQ